MNCRKDSIEASINFIQHQLDSLEHYLPETYQFLMENGLPAAGTNATEDSRILPESVMNPTADEYDWGKKRINPLEPVTHQDA